MDSSAAGRTIAGRYRVEGELGRGGMGTVFRAEHLALQSPVAIKLLDPSIATDPAMLDRFLREARAAAAIRSAHVVQIFDYGVDEGVPFIAMELLVGESLRERLDRVGRLSFAETARLFSHLTRAVTKAHDAGIVHRDLKPDNVFLVQDHEETAKILDFGIAKLGRKEPSDPVSVETASGTVLGTPYYMSPEQARGESSVDFRSDLWSLAVIAFECVTGSLPFESGPLGDVIVRICTTPAPRPSARGAVPDGFDAWFARGVEREPALRFQSAREMSDALSTLSDADPSTPPRGAPEARPGSTPTWVSPGGTPRDNSTERPATSDIVVLQRSTTGVGWALGVAAFSTLVLGGVVFLAGLSTSAPVPPPVHAGRVLEMPQRPIVTPATPDPAATAFSSSSPRPSEGAPQHRKGGLRGAVKPARSAPSASAPPPQADLPREPLTAPAPQTPPDGREIFSDRE